MSREGRSQPIQPVATHGFLGNVPANGTLPGRITVVENDDRRRRRYEPLPPLAVNGIYSTATAPVVVSPPRPVVIPITGTRTLPLPPVNYRPPVFNATVTTVIGELVLGAVAPTDSIGGSVSTAIGDLTLGAVAPTVTFDGSITTSAATLTLGATAPTITFTGSIITTIADLVLGAPLASTTGGSSGTVVRRSSFSHVTISLLDDKLR